MTLHRALHDDDGVALVEFAFVLPLMLVLLFGILDFGRAMTYWANETHLSSQAARYVTVNSNPGGTTLAEFETYFVDRAVTDELRDGTGSVTTPLDISLCFKHAGAAPAKGDTIRVTATSAYEVLGVIGGFTLDIESHSEMRLEAVPSKFADVPTCPADPAPVT